MIKIKRAYGTLKSAKKDKAEFIKSDLIGTLTLSRKEDHISIVAYSFHHSLFDVKVHFPDAFKIDRKIDPDWDLLIKSKQDPYSESYVKH